MARFLGEKLIERITGSRSEREEFELVVCDASEEFGGISFIGLQGQDGRYNGFSWTSERKFRRFFRAARTVLRVLEFVLLSMFSEHFAARRWSRTVAGRNVY
jgi:hypothetical protein